MKNFAFEKWDNGQLLINQQHASTLRAAGLTTFSSIYNYNETQIKKQLLKERVTSSFSLPIENGESTKFYLKCHAPAPIKEYIKPLLRFRKPILGAKNEWDALIHFHRAGIPTMVPVAYGEHRGHSLLVTESLDNCVKLSHWMQRALPTQKEAGENSQSEQARPIIAEVARIARCMHRTGMHHQDFYLGHLLMQEESAQTNKPVIHLIDLGRARWRARLSSRWIVKDLAQLDYSASQFTNQDRADFMQCYLGRPLKQRDQSLMQRIAKKSAAIAKHSQKNRL